MPTNTAPPQTMPLPAQRLLTGALTILSLALHIFAAPAAKAQGFTTLYSFNGGTDGRYPTSLVKGPDGNYYGATGNGGDPAQDAGTFFTITPDGALTTLHNFLFTKDLAGPQSLTLEPGGTFYGYTNGEESPGAVIFRITTQGQVTILYSFGANVFAHWPTTEDTDGSFYGLTLAGDYSSVSIYKIDSSGKLSTLHTFPEPGRVSLGGPGLVKGTDGDFYGTLNNTIFKITPSGILTTLNQDASFVAMVQGTDGNFYGVSDTDDGSVFKMTPAGALTTLFTFTGDANGEMPASLLQWSDGNFYGTTIGNIVGDGPRGTIFKITPSGVLTTLYTTPSDNRYSGPYNLISGFDNNLYGMTLFGGALGFGSVFRLDPTAISALTLSTSSVIGGLNSTATVTVASPAPAGGLVVNLSSSNSAAATAPATVTIPAGATSATFQVTTYPVATKSVALLTASNDGISQTAAITVNPPTFTSLGVTPSIVHGGAPSVGTVYLTGTAPAGGVVIYLASQNTAAATVPPTVTIPAGAASEPFPITTLPTASATAVPILAAAEGVTSERTLTVLPPTAVSITVNPSATLGGVPVTGTVTLSGPAPVGGLPVYLASWNTALATVPFSITAPAGKTTVSFGVTTLPVAVGSSVRIAAEAGGAVALTPLEIEPPTLATLVVNPSAVAGGAPTTGTVTLTSPAPQGGAVVYLASWNTALAKVPFSVTVAAGRSSASFGVTTLPTSFTASVRIAAEAGGVVELTPLEVTP